jgi:hypothetical protein
MGDGGMKRGKRNRKIESKAKIMGRDDIYRKLRIYNYRRGLLLYHKHIRKRLSIAIL